MNLENAITDAILETAIVTYADLEGKILFANDNFLRISKYSMNEILGKTHGILKSGVHPQSFYQELWQTILKGNKWRKDICNKNKEGSLYWVDSTIIPIKNDAGKISGYLSIRYEITDKKKIELIERKLRIEQELLFQSMIEGVVIQDVSGTIINYNKAALKILGLTDNQLLGRDSFHPEWRSIKPDGTAFPGEQHPAMVSLKTGKIVSNTIMGIQHADSTLHWIEINSVPIFEEEKLYPTKTITTFKEITEELRIQKDMLLSKERLEMAIDLVHFGVWDWDLKTNFVTWDANTYKIFGYNKNDFNNAYEKYFNAILPEDRELVKTRVDLAFQNKKEFNIEYRILRYPDKELRILKSQGRVLFDEQGQPVRMLGVNWDISEEKMKDFYASQNSKLATLGEMSASVAHEINNPLAIIAGKAHKLKKLLAEQNIDKETSLQAIESIEKTVTRIEKIIKGLKTYARYSDSDQFTPSDLKTIIDESLVLIDLKLLKTNTKLIKPNLDHEVIFECKEAQISQIIVNLVTNAIDAVSGLENSWVEIQVKDFEDKIEIRVLDSGTGIPLHLQKKMMQPFFTTKELGKGTGLGLSITSHMIKEHQGEFFIDNESANTCFVVTLPKKHAL